MATDATPDPQTSLWESELDDPELAELLERRQTLKDKRGKAASDYRKVDEAAKDRLEQLDVKLDKPVRIGKFVVSVRPVAARSVAFETSPTSRLNIRPIPEPAETGPTGSPGGRSGPPGLHAVT